ncbi:MAG: hypothetical protein ACREPX_06925 [Rhodanobacteraceae bacterium]
MQARVAHLDRTQDDLSARLPDAIERATEGTGSVRMAEALAQPVTQALGTAVRENRQIIVDVLFPVIGPAIRKAIAEALRTLVADLNGAIESSISVRGMRWRIEAWRSGVPFAQVVLKHTLTYRIDHVFLIERDSGIVLDRQSAPGLEDLDGDAIAGMLTAIGEFVHDSVGRGGGNTLDSARVGEHLLWVLRGPRANLACFIHGVPPAALHTVLEQRLEEIHTHLGDIGDGGGIDDAWRASLQPDQLARDANAAEPPRKAAARWPLLLILLAILGLVTWFTVRNARWNANLDALRTRVSAHPGFQLTGIEARGREALIVRGMLDPDAEPLDVSAGAQGGGVPVQLSTVGYVSTDDAVIARRARRLLSAPPGVEVAAQDGVLNLGGRADAAWIDAAREHAPWIAGVRDVRITATPNIDEAAIARQRLDALLASIPQQRVAFARDLEPIAGADGTVEKIARDAREAETLAGYIGQHIEWVAVGTNDDPGSASINARLRIDRANWLAYALIGRGIANVRSAGDAEFETAEVRQRGAFLRAIPREAKP